MLAAAPFIIILAAWAADKLWPLPLQEVNPARVVVAQDGTPLWRFADADGIWRYPVTIEDVSPRYLEALINYEDRWFWKHPGVNPFSVARAAWQDLTSGRVISGGSTLTMQVARLLDPHPKTFGGKIRQLWRALQLEWHLSKREVFTGDRFTTFQEWSRHCADTRAEKAENRIRKLYPKPEYTKPKPREPVARMQKLAGKFAFWKHSYLL